MLRLGVNIDHVATVREARKGSEPDPVHAAVLCELAGADGITVHLRGDRRHVQDRDVQVLRQTVRTRLNVEMATTQEMTHLALTVKPDPAAPSAYSSPAVPGGKSVKLISGEPGKVPEAASYRINVLSCKDGAAHTGIEIEGEENKTGRQETNQTSR